MPSKMNCFPNNQCPWPQQPYAGPVPRFPPAPIMQPPPPPNMQPPLPPNMGPPPPNMRLPPPNMRPPPPNMRPLPPLNMPPPPNMQSPPPCFNQAQRSMLPVSPFHPSAPPHFRHAERPPFSLQNFNSGPPLAAPPNQRQRPPPPPSVPPFFPPPNQSGRFPARPVMPPFDCQNQWPNSATPLIQVPPNIPCTSPTVQPRPMRPPVLPDNSLTQSGDYHQQRPPNSVSPVASYPNANYNESESAVPSSVETKKHGEQLNVNDNENSVKRTLTHSGNTTNDLIPANSDPVNKQRNKNEKDYQLKKRRKITSDFKHSYDRMRHRKHTKESYEKKPDRNEREEKRKSLSERTSKHLHKIRKRNSSVERRREKHLTSKDSKREERSKCVKRHSSRVRTNRSQIRESSRPKRRHSSRKDHKKEKKTVAESNKKENNALESNGQLATANENPEDESIFVPQTCSWIRSSPAELYYCKDDENPKIVIGSEKLDELVQTFDYDLVNRAERVRQTKPKYEPPARKTKLRKPKPPRPDKDSSSSTSEESSSEEEDTALEELEKKKQHPDRLHEELWYNDPGEMNDGPLCRCSAKARRSGIRHGIYIGESGIPKCNLNSNNANRLHHYRVTTSPCTNFTSKSPTVIKHDGHTFVFEGFSMFSHSPLIKLPPCKVIRFNIEYTVLYVEEKFTENFTVRELELFSTYLFREILELVDLNWKAHDDPDGCSRFHFMPRFARELEDNGKELLSMNVVLQYLLNSNERLIKEENLPYILSLNQHKWQDLADEVKGMIVTCPGMKPSSIRVDQLDRELCDSEKKIFPEIIHFGVRPPQLSYAGNPGYQKAWRDYVKFRHLLANKPKVCYADRHKLLKKELKLQDMRMKNTLKRDVTVVISSEKFYKTGIMCDIVQHAMLLPVLVCHLRFHGSLGILEQRIGYEFMDRYLLQLAFTHPSYRENFGTNPDHARNSLTNCGIRQPEYGDRRIHYMNTRKRGINTLINIMSRFGRREETISRINHNERLEFLGDAVVEFLSSIHLFFMFPNLEEGGLATYRAAIVQNQHLAVLAKKLQLEKFMLYAHGSDLCHDLELKHAMANCFEALMGALYLDQGIEVADKVFSETLFTEPELLDVWVNYPPHPLQEQEPNGDRKWLPSVPLLQKLHKFEESIGIEFIHIRLLARAFTHRSLGFNNLTLGSNQRLEFLGDTVLQLVASEYLYKFFPEHHEGHLSLLRSSLVNNRTQSVVCDDLGMVEYAIYPYPKVELKTKDRADLLEAFLGALYVDQGLDFCAKFCEVCFFPRLQDFIMNQDWNDPKSKLQQCCLTLRTMDGGEPDIPVYKVIECKGPTNTRVYTVAVYFRGRRLAVGSGHSIQQAEMAAAGNALNSSKDLFPQLNHQKRAIERSLKQRLPSNNTANT